MGSQIQKRSKSLPPYLFGDAGKDQFRSALQGWKVWYSWVHGTPEAQIAAATSIAAGVPLHVPRQDDDAWLECIKGRCCDDDPFYTWYDLTTDMGQQIAINAAKVAQASAMVQEVEGNAEPSHSDGVAAGLLIEKSIVNILKPATLEYLTNNAELRKLFDAAGIKLGGTGTTECENFHSFLKKRLVKAGLAKYDAQSMLIELARIQYAATKARKLLHGSLSKANSGQHGSSIFHNVMMEALNLMRFFLGDQPALNHLQFARRLANSAWTATTTSDLLDMGFKFSIRAGYRARP